MTNGTFKYQDQNVKLTNGTSKYQVLNSNLG